MSDAGKRTIHGEFVDVRETSLDGSRSLEVVHVCFAWVEITPMAGSESVQAAANDATRIALMRVGDVGRAIEETWSFRWVDGHGRKRRFEIESINDVSTFGSGQEWRLTGKVTDDGSID